MMEQAKRNSKITNMRALAILLVVLGHSIILYDPQWGLYRSVNVCSVLEIIKHFINVIQMPLFFSISGYCFVFSAAKLSSMSGGKFIIEKAKRLLIPYCVIALLWMIPLRLVSHYSPWEGLSLIQILGKVFSGVDNGHLWYLGALFEMFLLSLIVEKVIFAKNKSVAVMLVILVFALGLAVVSIKIPADYLFVKNFTKNYYWFFVGSLINRWRTEERVNKIAAWILLGVSAAGVCVLVLCSGSFHWVISALAQYPVVTLLLVAAYVLFPQGDNSVVSAYSKNSYGIYLFHSPLIYPVFCYCADMSPVIVVCLTFVVMHLIAFVLTSLLRKFGAGRMVIGERM